MKEMLTGGSDRDYAKLSLLVLAALAVSAAIVAALLVAHARPHGRVEGITLIYVGADDCAPCRAWQSGDGAAFRNSAVFQRIAYVEAKSSNLRDVLADANWPEAIRAYRNHVKRTDGVPLWLVVSGDTVTERGSGAAAWRSTVLPAVRSALRQAKLGPARPSWQPLSPTTARSP